MIFMRRVAYSGSSRLRRSGYSAVRKRAARARCPRWKRERLTFQNQRRRQLPFTFSVGMLLPVQPSSQNRHALRLGELDE